MASSGPSTIIGNPDDDGFDWDAAVRAIDLACESSSRPSTSTDPFRTPCFAPSDGLHGGSFDAPFAVDKRKNGGSRQSTLDKFIARSGLRIEPEYRAVPVDNGVALESSNANGAVSSVEIDMEAAKTWIYPVNVPLRDYQFSITKTALFTNTMVALPTGLGKTLIAAVVMYNYFRWFPEGKIVFTAPSRPLVVQQIEACHNIVGIPQELTIDMTGQICPTKRADFWKTKRVFFVTPQVLEKDIQSGTCLVKYLVCLVIDEAHRATGNYSYCVAVRELMAIPVQLRLLALTATPGSKQQTIQQVIDNLLISNLEYRNESDPDVSPYVHNRKVELIQVAMGEEAIQINNLLLNVIRIYAAKLNTMGIILNRDYPALSPSDLLNSRDRFRQAPPPSLPPLRYGEVERFFGALITLYHIRKLLSSHGIRPAYEMLEEKLQQGSFAGLMSRNEDIQKAKLLMQQNLSHGPPNPKLSKMLEVLTDHFKANDKHSSRVIIFSNFRGSVRDIMDALSKVGDTVKAAQFVGQSSGKSLKGQTQKVQQAVLEKFRSGGYNVIVATSIGEEGLDIMEVDLVICFDANVSPLRMVQRMGRTGRKHDGRVVVLACEGSELKAYMRKQANSKTVKKHMRNGGISSFNFHSSPRMVPHIFKPEVQFVELSIEKFVPRGKKVKDDHTPEDLSYMDKLTPEEANLIAKYFNNSENRWKPSLIAFPHFQTFPSGVHKVLHSCRTGMLIDSMQHLQGDIFSRSKDEEQKSLFGAELLGEQSMEEKGFLRPTESIDVNTEEHILHSKESPVKVPEKYEHPKPNDGNPPSHSCLFSSDFVTVDAFGNVSILLVPSLYAMEKSPIKRNASRVEHDSSVKMNYGQSCQSTEATNVPAEPTTGPEQTHSRENSVKSKTEQQFGLQSSNCRQSKPMVTVDRSMEIEHVEILQKKVNSPCHTPVRGTSPGTEDLMEAVLSPRLTNYIESGVVPESPIGASSPKDRSVFHDTDVLRTPEGAKICAGVLPFSRSLRSEKSAEVISETESLGCSRKISSSPVTSRNDFSLDNMKDGISLSSHAASPIVEIPLDNSSSGGCSRDWGLTPLEDPRSVKQTRKLKRLRRVGECGRYVHTKRRKNSLPSVAEHFDAAAVQRKQNREKRKPCENGRPYIEEEAEVSSGADTSDGDEADAENDDSYDDSFIDDQINPTVGSSQPATSVDMIAVYRRSLLSQSPMAWQVNTSSSNSPVVASSMSRSGGSSAIHSAERTPAESPCPTRVIPETGEASKVENCKRKRMIQEQGSITVPVVNLEMEFLNHTDMQMEENNEECDHLSDDLFYEGIDLDELEAQATLLIKNKSEHRPLEQDDIPGQYNQSSPSFDLGI